MLSIPNYPMAVIVFFVVFFGVLWVLHKLNISLRVAVVLAVALLVISVAALNTPVVGQLIALVQHR